jgi:hypothetical protein
METITNYLAKVKNDAARANSQGGKILITILESEIFNDSWELIGEIKTPAGIRNRGKTYQISDPKDRIGELIWKFEQWQCFRDKEADRKQTEDHFTVLLDCFYACAQDARFRAKGIQEKTLKGLQAKLEELKRKTVAGEPRPLKKWVLIKDLVGIFKNCESEIPNDVIFHRTFELLRAFNIKATPASIAKIIQRKKN